MPIDDRYQNQSWIVKLWRFRHYLPVPHSAVLIWYHEHTRPLEDEDDWRLRFTDCWSVAKGMAQCKMKYYWTSEELGYDFSSDIDDDGELQK